MSSPVPGIFGDRQCVDVGACQHCRSLAVGQHAHDSGAADLVDLIAQGTELRGDPCGGVMFCQSQLGMPVEMLVELALLGQLLLEGIDNFLYSTHFSFFSGLGTGVRRGGGHSGYDSIFYLSIGGDSVQNMKQGFWLSGPLRCRGKSGSLAGPWPRRSPAHTAHRSRRPAP